ncbi:MAG: hypothetical protein HFI11_10155 [Lachnospiraceae bacterium]|jgi:hypothetical protein|nr:hypothetical protein [Lachnospiraceae bacterium]
MKTGLIPGGAMRLRAEEKSGQFIHMSALLMTIESLSNSLSIAGGM